MFLKCYFVRNTLVGNSGKYYYSQTKKLKDILKVTIGILPVCKISK